MRRKIYRSLAVATIISCIVMVIFTWYVVGVIEKENTKEILESRVSDVSDTLYKKQFRYQSVFSDICDEYKSRARAFAMMLSKNTDIMSDDIQLEEMRTSIGADVISVFDENLQLDYTTGSFSEEQKVYREFETAVENKLFSSAFIDSDGETKKVIVGCSRIDQPGVIQIEYVSENVDTILMLMDVSKMFVGIPIMKTGSVAIIDNKSMNYIAHTDEQMVGKPSHFDLKKDFFGAEPFFNCEIQGEDVMLHFDFCNNQLVIGYVPYSEIYSIRNDIIKWVIAVAIIVSTVVTLTVRSKILHINKKERHNKKSAQN